MTAAFDASTSLSLLGHLQVYEDHDAWARFMTLYLPMMQVWARRFGLGDDDVGELTGRLLAKLVEALPKFEYDPAKGTFRGWLKTVTQRELATFARERARAPADRGVGGQDIRDLLNAHPDDVDELVNGLHDQSGGVFRHLTDALAADEAECDGEERKSWDMFRRIVLANEDIAGVAESYGLSYHAAAMRVQRVKKKVRERALRLAGGSG